MMMSSQHQDVKKLASIFQSLVRLSAATNPGFGSTTALAIVLDDGW